MKNYILLAFIATCLIAPAAAAFSARQLAIENLYMNPPAESVEASLSSNDEADAVFGEPPEFSNYKRMRYGRMDYSSGDWSW